jgi:hypothetical protein
MLHITTKPEADQWTPRIDVRLAGYLLVVRSGKGEEATPEAIGQAALKRLTT